MYLLLCGKLKNIFALRILDLRTSILLKKVLTSIKNLHIPNGCHFFFVLLNNGVLILIQLDLSNTLDTTNQNILLFILNYSAL